MKVPLIRQQQKQIILDTPWNPDFLSAFKREIPSQARTWDSVQKVWLVSEEFGDTLAELCKQHFPQFVDARKLDDDDDSIMDAVLEAEIEMIRQNQQIILANKAAIASHIKVLRQRISGYSYSSKSRIKAKLVKLAYMLDAAMENANTPAEQLVELEVRGMAAAVRYLKEEGIVVEEE